LVRIPHFRAAGQELEKTMFIFRLLQIGSAMALLTAVQADAQTYPAKAIRLIVATAPGGGVDTTARVLAKTLSGVVGQSVVVENRAGVGGIPGTEMLAKSAPDGYTLQLASSSHAVNPGLYPQLPYDSVRDFTYISLVSRGPNILVVHPSVPVKTVKDLIALARSSPDKLNYSSSGGGQASHLAAERFKVMTGVKMVHVPYKGTGPAVIGLLGGEVDLQFATLPSVLTHIRSGRLKTLGIGSARRSDILPEVPTIAESGVPGFEAGAWYGVIAPARTAPDIVTRLHGAIVKSVESPEVKDTLRRDGADPVGNRPDEFAAFIASEIPKWAAVVKSAGIKPE
jgi:tripartite-type tricarboxylate transporter receptor subunit TctC